MQRCGKNKEPFGKVEMFNTKPRYGNWAQQIYHEPEITNVTCSLLINSMKEALKTENMPKEVRERFEIRIKKTESFEKDNKK